MIIRWLDVDMLTGESQTGQAEGNLSGDYDTLRARVETAPGHKFVALTDEGRFNVDIEGMGADRIDALVPPEESIVRLPIPVEVDYDFASGWFTPRSRLPFEDAIGKTKPELVTDMVARGAPLAWATTTVDAREGEYDAYDPLEGVHPYGTPIEDIFAAAIVAAERRAARRAT